MKKSIPVLVLFLCIATLAAGCTLRSGNSTEPVITPAPVPAVTLTASPVPTPTTFSPDFPSVPLVGEYTTVPTTRPASDNPFIEELSIRKRTFINPLPSCFMEHAFPPIATDPEYGIRQVVPKLSWISEHEYKDFLRDWTEGEAENTPLKTPAVCQNTRNEPTWNFIEIRLILVPTNPAPSWYTVGENILSDGNIVARFTSDERLVIDEKRVITRYVPIRADEVDLVDTAEATFTRY